jgi:hypothetical protein
MKSKVILATLVTIAAPSPLVTTQAHVPVPGVTLFTLSADPVVAPDIENNNLELELAIELLPKVSVRSELEAIDTLLNVTEPTRPLHVTVPDAAPEAVTTGRTKPSVAVETTKLPAVAVMLPVVAVRPVPPVTVPLAETLPDEAAILPVVAVIPVPAVIVVVAAREVVVVKEPGAVIADGKETTAALLVVTTVI